jgi:hypothetical protein
VRRARTARAAIPAAAVGVFLLVSCSTGTEKAAQPKPAHALDGTLCRTEIGATVLKDMYPGPYSGIKMLPSEGGGIKGIDIGKGKVEGHCDVWITQTKGDVFSVVKVYARVDRHETADDLFAAYKNSHPADVNRRIALGFAKGYTTYKNSVLYFDCHDPRRHVPDGGSFGVSTHVLLPDHPNTSDADRTTLADGAAELVAETARYVSSTVLECADPSLPAGTPAQKPGREP